MSQMTRHCPGCGGNQLFERHHDDHGGCPDTLDGSCPEWACPACGTALILSFVPRARITESLPREPDRAA